MIPRERDDTMLVTLTVGQLSATISEIVAEQVSGIKNDIIEAMRASDKRTRNADTLVGMDEIAHAVGCNRNTIYTRMKQNPRLKACIKGGHKGKKIASRAELLAAMEG